MQIKKYCGVWLAAAAVTLILATSAQATLQARDLDGNGASDAVYDTGLNITWLRDANVNGQTDWVVANNWANDYSFGGYSDWRLPTTTLLDSGCSYPSESAGSGCNGSEMGHLFYDALGGVAGSSILDVNNGQLALFTNVQAGRYWSSTPSPSFPGPYTFIFGSGDQDSSNSYFSSYNSWLVRPGDVAGAQVPEPTTLWLALGGLAGLGVARRRRPV